MAKSSSTGRIEVPEAKEAMDRFKMEVAGELGVPLTNGYNGSQGEEISEEKIKNLYREEDKFENS